MTYSHADLAQIESPLWFCLKAHPKREHLAAAALHRQCNILCWSPRVRFRKITRRGPVWFVEALFPGYFFAEFVYAKHRRLVEHSLGVQYIVEFGEHVGAIEASIIASLQQSAGDDEVVTIDPEIQIGQSVQIIEGPLEGLHALVTHLIPAKERVRVLLEFLGRSLETEVAAPRVLPSDSVRHGFSA